MFIIDITKIIITYISPALLPYFFIYHNVNTTITFTYNAFEHSMNVLHYLKNIFPNIIITRLSIENSYPEPHDLLHVNICENSCIHTAIAFLKKCNQLISLTISNTSFQIIPIKHSTLKFLHLKHKRWVLDCPNLHTLTVERNIPAFLPSMTSNCPKLKVFNLIHCRINDFDFIKEFTNLREITFHNCYFVSVSSQSEPFIRIKKVIATVVDKEKNDTDMNLAIVVSKFLLLCPNLQSLAISNSAITNDQLMLILTTHHHLKHLKITNCPNITKVHVQTNLRTLDLSHCENLEDMKGLGTNLKYASIEGCHKLTNLSAFDKSDNLLSLQITNGLDFVRECRRLHFSKILKI